MVFTNAFCASPLCAPARAALATGRYTYITANGERAHDGHESILRPSDVIFQEYLKATGYKTKHAGKGHLGTQKYMDAFDENDNAWDRWAPPIYDDELYLDRPAPPGREAAALQEGDPHAAAGPQDRARQRRAAGSSRPTENPFRWRRSTRITWCAAPSISWMPRWRIGAGSPIYLQLDIFDPHQPFSIPDGLEDREKALRAVCSKLPASYERVRAADWKAFPNEPKIYDTYRKNWGLYDPRTATDYRVANALQMEVVDRALVKLIDALKVRGLYDESIVVFTSDHGEMNGRQAMIDKGVYLYPDVLRVPLAVKMPKSTGARHHSVEAPVCHLDIAPTLLAVAGVEPMERLDGRSLLPHLNGTAPSSDRELFFECGWHVGVNFACGTQKWTAGGEHYLYSFNVSSPFDELYDLHATDAENLASSPEHRKIHAEMVQRLGAMLDREPRWLCYSGPLHIDHYFDLPKQAGDVQMFRPL